MDDIHTITACPICGAEIQATEELWHTQVVLNREGDVEDYRNHGETGEFRVYCKNDHTHDEMMSHLRGVRSVPDSFAELAEAAKKWNGYGTALKPAQEPAVLARKPFGGTVAGCVLEHGTGALNIDGCRFAYGDEAWPGPGESWDVPNPSSVGNPFTPSGDGRGEDRSTLHDLGRWPANIYAHPKASRSEREAGCERLPGRTGAEATDRTAGSAGLDNPRAGAGRTADRVKNHHPTVKPIGVMRWLCKLTGGQRGSVILDPFMGSGTTGCAAVMEGFDFIGIEREPEYMQICEARIRHHMGALFAHGVQVIETDKAAK